MKLLTNAKKEIAKLYHNVSTENLMGMVPHSEVYIFAVTEYTSDGLLSVVVEFRSTRKGDSHKLQTVTSTEGEHFSYIEGEIIFN